MSGRRYDRLNLEDSHGILRICVFCSHVYCSSLILGKMIQLQPSLELGWFNTTRLQILWFDFVGDSLLSAMSHENNTILKDMVCVCTLLSTIPSKSKVGCIHNACVAKLRKEMALVWINPGLHFSCPNESHGFFWIYNLAPPFASWSTMTMCIFHCWFNLSQKKAVCMELLNAPGTVVVVITDADASFRLKLFPHCPAVVSKRWQFSCKQPTWSCLFHQDLEKVKGTISVVIWCQGFLEVLKAVTRTFHDTFSIYIYISIYILWFKQKMFISIFSLSTKQMDWLVFVFYIISTSIFCLPYFSCRLIDFQPCLVVTQMCHLPAHDRYLGSVASGLGGGRYVCKRRCHQKMDSMAFGLVNGLCSRHVSVVSFSLFLPTYII